MENAIAIPHKNERVSNRYLVLALWIAVAAIYLSLAGQWILFHSRDQQLNDYMSYVVALGAAEHRPAKEIRALLLVRAEDLALPLRHDQIQIVHGGDSLRASIDYQTHIRIPLLDQPVYQMEFRHEARAGMVQ